MRAYKRITGLLKEYEDIDVEKENYDEKLNKPEDTMFSWEEFIYGKEAGVS